MKTAIVVMTVLGCGHGENACEYIKTIDEVWATPAQCQAETESHLKASADANYPTVIAVCVEKPQSKNIAEEPIAPPVVRDVVVREAGVLDRIYDSLPDVEDAQAAVSGLVGVTRSGSGRLSEWLW